jgi:hypothetical protein
MDYHRIYREFIADRKSKGCPDGYSERHHILPRALGGGDEPENLIRLTAEDHFFAHLLLAKAHGGTMWIAVMRMMGARRRQWCPRKSRRAYGWAKKARSKAMSGLGHPNADGRLYDLEHKDGRIWRGYRCEMSGLGISGSLSDLLVAKKVGYAKGWFLRGHRPKYFTFARPGADNPCADSRCYNIDHVDGRKFKGTQIEIREYTGIAKSCCSMLLSGRRQIVKGWRVAGSVPSRSSAESLGRGNIYVVINGCGESFIGRMRWARLKAHRMISLTRSRLRKGRMMNRC